MNNKSRQKKITGFQFIPGSLSEVLVTSADSRVRVIDGDELVHKFKGFRNTQTQISASITRNGRYIIAASEDSNVYMWRRELDSGHRESKTVTVTQAYENFHCQDVSVAIPWCGSDDLCCLNDVQGQNEENPQIDKDRSSSNSPTIANTTDVDRPSSSPGGSTSKIFGMPGYSLHDVRRASTSGTDLSSYGMLWNKSSWGMVIVTGGLRGELKTFQNFGLPTVRK